MKEVYENIINIGNKSPGTVDLGEVKDFCVTINDEKIKNGQNVKNIANNLIKYKTDQNINIKINNININDITNTWINEFVYIVETNAELKPEINLDSFYKNNVLIEFVKKMHFDLFNITDNDLESYKIINLLNCTNLKNKIIIIKDKYNLLDKNLRLYLKNTIIPVIGRNNFVLFEN
jgi:hypothetical protein